MKILVACEESQEVCKAFRFKGHEAFSCDIQECSGGYPEWHIKCNVLNVLNPTHIIGFDSLGISFKTMDGSFHFVDKWDLIIAHPPCTYLSTAATQCHSIKCYSIDKIAERTLKRIDSMCFFMEFVNANCDKIAIENPQGVMSACYRQPDQVVHPYYFAESIYDSSNYFTKKTCLWLKGLPPLKFECILPNPLDNADRWTSGKKKNWTESNHGGKNRSKTFPGIAKAMAEQWG